MTETISASQTLTAVECNTKKLLPLLSLLEAPEGPDRLTQLMELLTAILDAQHKQALGLKALIEKVDRIARR